MHARNLPDMKKSGFTLVEIAIVIVIIGLIVGGVLVGRDLINSADIRAQISQIEEFKAAVSTFRVKYGYLPGDMPPDQAAQLGFFTFTGANAGKYCSAGPNTYAFGNNDGILNSYNEAYPFWSHLADAKLIKGNYGGTAGNILFDNAPAGCFISTAGMPQAGFPPLTVSEYEVVVPHSRIG